MRICATPECQNHTETTGIHKSKRRWRKYCNHCRDVKRGHKKPRPSKVCPYCHREWDRIPT